MPLPDLLIIDDALSSEAHAAWCARVATLEEQSTGQSASECAALDGGELVALARETVGELELIHAPLFSIRQGHETEMHQDIGEYACVYYPNDCPTGPLRIDRGNGEESIDVVANRLVCFNATTITHQQVIPEAGSVRHSVALKFRQGT